MPTVASRQHLRREEELALARRLAELHRLDIASPNPGWNLATFEHRSASAGCTLLAVRSGEHSDLRIRIAEVSGLNPVAATLAAQCGLELLRRNRTGELGELNEYFLANPPGDHSMIAAGTLRFDAADSTWGGRFAGLHPPLAIHPDGGVEQLRGSGPFLGLTRTTFPIVHGRLRPGGRLLLLAGSGAGEVRTELLAHLMNAPPSPLDEFMRRLGSDLAADLEPGFGLSLIGIERNRLPVPGAELE